MSVIGGEELLSLNRIYIHYNVKADPTHTTVSYRNRNAEIGICGTEDGC